jgi:hypothetical protein
MLFFILVTVMPTVADSEYIPRSVLGNPVSAQVNESSQASVVLFLDAVKQTGYAPDRLLVRYKTGEYAPQTISSVQADLNSQAGASVMTDYSDLGLPGLELVRLAGSSVPDAIRLNENSPYITYAEPDYACWLPDADATPGMASSSSTGTGTLPNDTYFPEQ